MEGMQDQDTLLGSHNTPYLFYSEPLIFISFLNIYMLSVYILVATMKEFLNASLDLFY